jgi:carboxymethylenebutenolidase
MIRNIVALTFAFTSALAPANLLAAVAATVKFPSADGKTQLIGYVFEPHAAGPHPGVVMLHGRAGPYSSLKRGSYTAQSLSARHAMWGKFWARRGYVAVLVDSFGPRGRPEGFPKHSYRDRPGEVSEQWVRPLDAYGALAYLRHRGDVIADRIGLQGWSNGGMTLLSAMASDAPGLQNPDVTRGFRAAIAQYPSCRTQLRQSGYKPYAPLLIFAASDDDEVSPNVCREFAETMQARGESVEFVLYDGAQHSYDDPGKPKQSHPPNHAAMLDTQRRVETFFQQHLKP